jgi:plastocyanin
MLRRLLPICLLALAAGAAAPVDHEIVQNDRAFSQREITIKIGDRITFKNADEVAHNVYSATPGMTFDLRRQAPGESSAVPFLKEGTSLVQCAIHPKMKLIVHITK